MPCAGEEEKRPAGSANQHEGCHDTRGPTGIAGKHLDEEQRRQQGQAEQEGEAAGYDLDAPHAPNIGGTFREMKPRGPTTWHRAAGPDDRCAKAP
jgi:hypothetical protein